MRTERLDKLADHVLRGGTPAEWDGRQRKANGHAQSRKPSSNDLVTEDNAALRFAELYRDRLRYCCDTGAWFEWDGTAWRRNRTGLAFTWARELARDLASEEVDRVRYITSSTR